MNIFCDSSDVFKENNSAQLVPTATSSLINDHFDNVLIII